MARKRKTKHNTPLIDIAYSPSEKKVSGISGLWRPCSARTGITTDVDCFCSPSVSPHGWSLPTDVTDAEFALIEPLLPPARRGGRRRTTLLREVLNALLYLLRTGCPGRMLPREFPPRSTVYGYFRRFWQEGIWSAIQTTLLMAAREQAGRDASPTAGIIDSQSVKTTQVGGRRGFDAAKKLNGRKRHLLTDTLGLPLWLVVHAANVQYRDGLGLVCAGIRRRFPWRNTCSPMPATRATSPCAPPLASACVSRSSSVRARPKASTCCHGAG